MSEKKFKNPKTLDLTKLIDNLHNTKLVKGYRKAFLKELNGLLSKYKDMAGNVNFGEYNTKTHEYEYQLVISNVSEINVLRYLALHSNFTNDIHLNELELFITRNFRNGKMPIKITNFNGSKYVIQKPRVNLDDPRKFNSKDQTGIKFWVEFRISPRATAKEWEELESD